MLTRLMIHMRDGTPHVLDFEDEQAGKAALDEVQNALSAHGPSLMRPVTIAGRVVVRPADVRSAELEEPPGIG